MGWRGTEARASAAWAAGLAIATCLWAAPARAFELDGHEVIEAAAYKRLLALDAVPGTGVSGRALLASLVATGYLFEPPCFDRAHPRGDCGAAQRLDLPMLYWPTLASGAADLVIDRQLGQQGQCQHFMARTSDGLTPVDPRYGAPGALATTAYSRCVNLTGVVFDGILRDPYLAHERLVGTYVLMHAIEDSFSAAHVDRDARFRIVHLLSWTLIDWPAYAWRGNLHFPPSTHHAVTDKRDLDYIRWDQRTRDGVACSSFHNPYAFPEECLTDRARAARDAVVDLLVITYRLEANAAARGRRPSLTSTSTSPASPEDAALWMAFLEANLSSVAAPPQMPSETQLALRRPDGFVGAQAIFGPHDVGLGVWGTRFFLGPAVPFVLALTGAAAFSRIDGARTLGGSASLGLLLPLVRRFAIGTAPAAFRVFCDTSFKSCTTDVGATFGVLIVPLGEETWLGVEGPSWSWTTRSVGNTWVGLSFGWSHESAPDPHPPGPEAVADWSPPRLEEVHAFREARSTRAIYVAASALSRAENQFVGMGIDWRRDRDPWNRRAGPAPELQLEVDQGRIDGADRGGILAAAPSLRDYVVPDRLALTATPALVRVGTLAGGAVGVDVAARAGVVLDLGKVEISVDSPPLSYVSRSRWHGLPFSLRLGLLLD